MTNGIRRLTALLLTLMMALSAAPGTALAAEAGADAAAVEAETIAPEQAEPVDWPEDDREETWTDGEVAEEELEETGELYAISDRIVYQNTNQVVPGGIRYVSQKPSSRYYDTNYWGKYAGNATKWYCKSADVSMMLSYLGIHMLPKDIIPNGGDNRCMYKDWGEAKVQTGLSFNQAMENYLLSNGVYSPVMIRLANGCFKKSGQHYVLVVGRKSSTSNQYLVLDPYQDDTYYMTVSGNKFQFKWGKSWHESKFTEIYQYHLEQPTREYRFSTPRNRYQGTAFSLKGWFYGSEVISSVSVAVKDLNGAPQKGCSLQIAPNAVGFRLSTLSSQFRVQDLAPGFYRFEVAVTNAGGQECFHVDRAFTVLGKARTVGSKNAAFYLDSGPAKKYCVTPVSAAKNQKTVNATLVRNSEKKSMQFAAVYAGKGYYTLTNVASGKLLTVDGSGKSAGTQVVLQPEDGSLGQQWQILLQGKENGETYYNLIPRCAPRCCLTVGGEDVTDSPVLQIQPVTEVGAVPQKWIMRPVRPNVTKVTNTRTGLQVKWTAVPKATGYVVYRDGKKVFTTKDQKKTKWLDTTASNSKTHAYALRAVFGNVKSPKSPAVSRLRMAAPAVQKVTSKKRGRLDVYWKANSKAAGYRVCVARSAAGKSARYKVVSAKAKHCALTKLARKRTYFVKVQVIYQEDGKTVYSAWSNWKTKKVHQ